MNPANDELIVSDSKKSGFTLSSESEST